jgi:hypothetical protein
MQKKIKALVSHGIRIRAFLVDSIKLNSWLGNHGACGERPSLGIYGFAGGRVQNCMNPWVYSVLTEVKCSLPGANILYLPGRKLEIIVVACDPARRGKSHWNKSCFERSRIMTNGGL